MLRRTTAAALVALVAPLVPLSQASAEVTRMTSIGRQLGASVSVDAPWTCSASPDAPQDVFISLQRWEARGNSTGTSFTPWLGLGVFTSGACGTLDIASQTFDLSPTAYTDSSIVQSSLKGATLSAKFPVYDGANVCTLTATVNVTLTATTKVGSATTDTSVAHAAGYHELFHSEGKYVQANATGTLVLESTGAPGSCPLASPIQLPINAVRESDFATIGHSLFGYSIISKN